ncbi:MAG: transglycosylase SLT domain-containing protein [Bacilli bacterium]
MRGFNRKWLAVLLSLLALLLPVGLSGASFASLSRETAAAAAATPKRPGRVNRVRHRRASVRRQNRRANTRRRAHDLPASREAARAIAQALRITHEPHSWLRPLAWLAFHESAYNDRAVAWEDVGGQSACGLFQVLPTTFAAHSLPGFTNIWNPVDNAVAAVRYIAGRYGTPQAIPGLESPNYAGY